eukprot:1607947-Pleurochrysis_carterae.AAC.1
MHSKRATHAATAALNTRARGRAPKHARAAGCALALWRALPSCAERDGSTSICARPRCWFADYCCFSCCHSVYEARAAHEPSGM